MVTVIIPDNDAETPSPQSCPACGRPYDDAPIDTPFVLRARGLLDLVAVVYQDLHTLPRAREEVAL